MPPVVAGPAITNISVRSPFSFHLYFLPPDHLPDEGKDRPNQNRPEQLSVLCDTASSEKAEMVQPLASLLLVNRDSCSTVAARSGRLSRRRCWSPHCRRPASCPSTPGCIGSFRSVFSAADIRRTQLQQRIGAKLHGPSYARTMESLGCRTRFAGDGKLAPPMLSVRSDQNRR